MSSKTDEALRSLTERMIAAIEDGGTEWKRSWTTMMPVSVSTGKPYRGINALALGFAASNSARWGTFKAWRQLGASVRKGERATPVWFWKADSVVEPGEDGEPVERRRTFARLYYAFSADQVDGYVEPEVSASAARRQHSAADALLARLDSLGVAVRQGTKHSPAYIPARNEITMPLRASFESDDDWAATLAHEAVHATGPLLKRTFGRYGSHEYAVEELTAELGAALWSMQQGIDPVERSDHVAYLGSWCKLLGEHPKVLHAVSSAAQRAVDLLVGQQPPATVG